MPDVKFYGYGDADMGEFKAKNFEHKGTLKKEEWEKFVYNCSAYLRLVRHDTRPLASDEFIMAGRSVITNIPALHMDLIDSAGTYPFDKWDQFGPGFSPRRWPETKKKIVQKIREIKKFQQTGEFQIQRVNASVMYKELLDKDNYRKTIRSMAYAPCLEVVHA
jgi:hypothetical protein